MEYKFIHFVVIEEKPKTKVYQCLNNSTDSILGIVKYYGPWRQYCFFPEMFVDLVFSKGCLDDISDFLTKLKG